MIKYSFCKFISCIVSCSINNNQDNINNEVISYEKKIDSILGLMTIEEKIGQMTQIDQQFLDTIQDIADYSIGHLSGEVLTQTLIILKLGPICMNDVKKLLFLQD